MRRLGFENLIYRQFDNSELHNNIPNRILREFTPPKESVHLNGAGKHQKVEGVIFSRRILGGSNKIKRDRYDQKKYHYGQRFEYTIRIFQRFPAKVLVRESQRSQKKNQKRREERNPEEIETKGENRQTGKNREEKYPDVFGNRFLAKTLETNGFYHTSLLSRADK